MLHSKLLFLEIDSRDEKEAARCRKENGFKEIKKGNRKCLKCDDVFLSSDLKNIRMCYMCRLKRETQYDR